MNEGQKMFYGFIMNIVEESKKEEASVILKECFVAQDEGKFDKAYLDEIMPKLRAVVKKEGLAQLEQAMNHFKSKLS